MFTVDVNLFFLLRIIALIFWSEFVHGEDGDDEDGDKQNNKRNRVVLNY